MKTWFIRVSGNLDWIAELQPKIKLKETLKFPDVGLQVDFCETRAHWVAFISPIGIGEVEAAYTGDKISYWLFKEAVLKHLVEYSEPEEAEAIKKQISPSPVRILYVKHEEEEDYDEITFTLR